MHKLLENRLKQKSVEDKYYAITQGHFLKLKNQ